MAPRPRVLDQRSLNRALLARQLLLDRSPLAIPKALDGIGGIQAQYAPSMYVGLWSRLAEFRRDALTEALQRRDVVQATLMRATIHLVSASDYWPMALATRQARRNGFLRSRKGLTAEALAEAAARVRECLAQGPQPRKELERVGGAGLMLPLNLWLDLVRVPPSGTWERRRADLFGLAETWVGPPPPLSESEAVVHLVRRYLQGFGPASRADIASWTGLPVRVVADALGALHVRRFQATDGTGLVDLPRLPLPDPRTPAPVRFLPPWDATLLAHARRTGLLREEYRPRIFTTSAPQSVGTFLVDGTVAGTWRPTDGGVEVAPFEELDPEVRREVDEEAERLAAFHR